MINKLSKLRDRVIAFTSKSDVSPVLAAFTAGLYPLLYTYNSNFTLVCSWSQFGFYVLTFILIPVIVFWLLNYGVKRIKSLHKYDKYLIPVLNFTAFTFFIILSTYGFKKKILVVALCLAAILAVLMFKHIKKIVVLQVLMSGIVALMLIPKLLLPFNSSTEWMTSADGIENVKFKNKPNIYIIQPDGYANFSELKKENYNFDNSEFETFLTNNDFKLYPNFRSNYFSTLSSNASMFAMNHHFYNNVKGQTHEFYNARKIVIGDNPVVTAFKQNDYKTFLLLQKSYLLVNRSKILYDYCNIDYSEVPFMAQGFGVTKTVKDDLEFVIKSNKGTNNFHFIEQISPGHIATFKSKSKGKVTERTDYLENLKEANIWLKDIIQLINANDKDAMIVIVADHGGFVGLDYTLQTTTKLTDNTLVKSAFTSALAIKWPNNKPPNYDEKLKTSVNLFRVLFAYLGENIDYITNLEDDKSYFIIKEGAPEGVYEVMNNEGHVTFKKTTN